MSVDTDLRYHAEILWYPLLTDTATVMADWSMHPGYVNHEVGAPNEIPVGPKFQFIDAPEFGTKAVRWTSMSLNPDTRFAHGDGSSIMNWKKYINSVTKTQGSGTAVGNVARTELYSRYCFMLEADVWTGMNEGGVKLGGLDNALGHPNHVGGVFWHRRPDATKNNEVSFTTYWYGIPYSHPSNNAAHVIPWGQVIIQPDTWHCVEERLKMNTMNGSTPNADAIREVWFDDKLVYSKTNFVLNNYVDSPTTPLEIRWFHGQIFHGGGSTPLTPIHYRVTAFALAERRIGAPKRIR